jgi:STIP1 homology and U-box containing protein 1
MKAYYHLAQAQIALHRTSEALESSKAAHRFCVEEIYRGGKGGSSIGPITELVLRCKKEWWEEKEEARLKAMPGLLQELIGGLEQKKKWALKAAIEEHTAPNGIMLEEEVRADVERQYKGKIEELRSTFEVAGRTGEEGRRRKVPDWCVDDISFAVMLDPVVVSPIFAIF